MRKCCIFLAFMCCAFAGYSQDPVARPVHAIPAETLKGTPSDTKKLPLEENKAILSAETSRDKKQVTITPMPVSTSPPKETPEIKSERK
jgi:hypothetical protein